ncbi:hypothetical protein VT52_021880 [Streptomyces malaysiense]|uniref:Transposase IS4 N-terminal domain-containing protein n=1 Tax=Streptomyces malaysiense TaxID=1428626 RepID=A0A1J4PXS5_9ACTN|nr:hypothetical protein VT52_021880 [Streptomyces malaysiense]
MTVAAGLFAHGHLGEPTAVVPFELVAAVPFELVAAVPAETRTVQRRLRDLPPRVGRYFLLAMCLFPEVGNCPDGPAPGSSTSSDPASTQPQPGPARTSRC